MISCSQNETTGQQGNFLNPIIAGFYPDPSICKAGDSDYYLVNSSFSYFPGIPIFHSKDLVNWQQIGNAMDRPEQMDVSGLRMSRGIFAPSIRYNKGTYYITCTLVDAGGNFIITAENPAGPWSDPVFIPEIEHIDPSLFFDDDGKVYILYNSVAPDNKPLYSGHRTIRMMEFDIEKLTVIGEEVLLINGGHDISTKPVWIEGPHIYKVNGTYFLTAGEGGTYENHSQVIFKSGQVNGPYISYEKNPILTQKHLDPLRENPITSTGHADFVEDAGGNWWAVFLGCRPYKDELYNTGRETFMAPVKWIEGWPVINPDFEEVQYSYPINTLRKENAYPLNGNFTIRDEFDSANLHYNWVFQRTVKEKWYSLTDGYLSINLRPDICNDKTNPSFIGRRQQHLTGSASVSMQFEPKKTEEKAGLSIFQNETHYYFVCKSLAANKPVVQLFKSNEAGMELLSELPLKSNKNIRLKIEANRDTYAVYYANENEEYQLLSDGLDAGFVSTKGAGGVTFVGSTYGMYATSMGVPSDTKAHYDWFEYSGNDATFIINEKAE
jgi:alpha-N-arabinofuranosidase